MRVTADEADSMAAGCGEGKCWAEPGQFCKTPSGTKRRPHPLRVDGARAAELLGGRGRAWLRVWAAAQDHRRALTRAGELRVLAGEWDEDEAREQDRLPWTQRAVY